MACYHLHLHGEVGKIVPPADRMSEDRQACNVDLNPSLSAVIQTATETGPASNLLHS